MTVFWPVMCNDCKHRYFQKNDRGKAKCKAFPKGIPDEIYWDLFDHTKPYPGDNGIRFEPMP